MKEGYIVLGGVLLFQLGRVVYFYYQKWKLKKIETEITDNLWETYLKLREEILKIKPTDLDLKLLENTEAAFGVALETHTGREVQLIVVFNTGEIWILSTRNARKDIFIPENESFAAAVTSLLATAQYNFARMRREHTHVPEPGHTKFHIFTNYNVYSADSLIQDIISETSDWQELYSKLNEALEQSED